jgi:Large-conductance mechanosensitive channel, MscL
MRGACVAMMWIWLLFAIFGIKQRIALAEHHTTMPDLPYAALSNGRIILLGGLESLKEFKEFAMRGIVVDLAIGVIIGAAFGKIID